MKMEHTVTSPSEGIVDVAHFNEGDLVDEGTVLMSIRSTVDEGSLKAL